MRPAAVFREETHRSQRWLRTVAADRCGCDADGPRTLLDAFPKLGFHTLLRPVIHGRHSVNPSWAWLGTPDGTCRSGSRRRSPASRRPPVYVDVGAVEAADVNDLEFAVLPSELGVPAADGVVVEVDVAVAMPPGGCDGLIQQEPRSGCGAALDDKQG